MTQKGKEEAAAPGSCGERRRTERAGSFWLALLAGAAVFQSPSNSCSQRASPGAQRLRDNAQTAPPAPRRSKSTGYWHQAFGWARNIPCAQIPDPSLTYSEVSPAEQNGAYSQVSMRRTAAEMHTGRTFTPHSSAEYASKHMQSAFNPSLPQ